ncbi:hypothetical protein EJ02DRAFT_454198 [Clathrospora elynae]|uniref:Uncharacterized protein n=1 Tax=Clathrospora elynae TaxID=706981 RepID=A0A6A5SVB2_9PLEO|nr:hypothetical protein EJ02DRAFT_454198 [Clathrospora elynae]
MAPRRSGSSSSESSYSSCPGGFSDTITQASFASTVLYLAVFLGISVALFLVRKKSSGGKRLLGVPYTIALVSFILSFVFGLISTVLMECSTTDIPTYYDLTTTSNVFYSLGTWELLFVVVYTLNTMLRKHIGGLTTVFRVVFIAIVGVMFLVICGQTVLSAYNLAALSESYYRGHDRHVFIEAQKKLGLAETVLYLLSVVASGGLSLMAIFAMRSRRLPGGDLIGWVVALTVSMVASVLVDLVFAVQNVQGIEYTWQSTIAWSYIGNFFQALSFINLLCIAKHVAWSKTTATTQQEYAPVTQQPVYGHNTNGQQ